MQLYNYKIYPCANIWDIKLQMKAQLCKIKLENINLAPPAPMIVQVVLHHCLGCWNERGQNWQAGWSGPDARKLGARWSWWSNLSLFLHDEWLGYIGMIVEVDAVRFWWRKCEFAAEIHINEYVYMCIYMIQIFVFDVESIFSSKRIAISASYCRVTVWKNMPPLVFEIQSPLQRRCYPMLWSFRVWRLGNGVCHFPPSLIRVRLPSNGYVQNTEYCTYFLRNCNLQLCRYQSRSFWTSKDTDPQQHVSNKPQAQDQNPDFWWVVFYILFTEVEREKEEQKQDRLFFLPTVASSSGYKSAFYRICIGSLAASDHMLLICSAPRLQPWTL